MQEWTAGPAGNSLLPIERTAVTSPWWPAATLVCGGDRDVGPPFSSYCTRERTVERRGGHAQQEEGRGLSGDSVLGSLSSAGFRVGHVVDHDRDGCALRVGR